MRVVRGFEVSGINIRVHTKHSPEEYTELWRQLHRLRGTVTRSSNTLMIGEARSEDKEDPRALIYGSFYRFLDVKPDDPWFNIQTRKKATDEDVERVNIPHELKPNLVEIPYVFDVVKHRLYFVSKEKDIHVSPVSIHNFLNNLCERISIAERFGKVDLTVLTDKGQVDELLSWPVIRTLTIKIDRPNPNDYDDEAAFYEKLHRRRAESETRIYKKASTENSLIPDDEIRSLAHIAADNGEVEVSGQARNRSRMTASSKKFPLRIPASYITTLETLRDALKTVVLGRR